ncbi:MAG: hypothetical protein IJW13_06390 [Clostridia bacterium]|nr:hypothetical protein [Clostridia bacterium]
MNKAKTARIIVVIAVILLLALCAVMLKSCSTKQTLIQFNGKITGIEVEEAENRVILNISGTNVNFVWYQSDISIDFSKSLNVGDDVTLFVQDNYNRVKLARIYSLTVNGEIAFDKEQSNFEENKQISYMCAVMIITLCCTLLFVAFKRPFKQPVYENGFVIRLPISVYYSSLCILTTALAGAIATMIIAGANANARKVALILLLIAVCCAIMLYVYFAERFVFDGREFVYYLPFLKPRRALASEVKCVNLSRAFFTKVIFVGSDGSTLMQFRDDGRAFLSGEFINKLKQLKIPLAGSIYRKQFEGSKLIVDRIVEEEGQKGVLIRLRFCSEEYMLSFKECEWTVQNNKGQNIGKFSSFYQLAHSAVLNGYCLFDHWEKVEVLAYFSYIEE